MNLKQDTINTPPASDYHTKMSTTTLSEHVWNLKNNNIEHCISWEIIENSHPHNNASKKCNLCTAEKYFILTGKPTLNKKKTKEGRSSLNARTGRSIYYKTYGRAAQHGRVYSNPEDSGRTFPLETQCSATMITR